MTVINAPRANLQAFKWLTPVEEKTFELHEATAA